MCGQWLDAGRGGQICDEHRQGALFNESLLDDGAGGPGGLSRLQPKVTIAHLERREH